MKENAKPSPVGLPSWINHHLDQEKMHKVLLACGQGAAVLAVTLVTLKLAPVVIIILPLPAGLAGLTDLWQHLREIFPEPHSAT